MLTKEELVSGFCEIGLVNGDIVLVHSALRKLGPVDGGADTVIDALLQVVGNNGTVAMPTHTWKVVNREQPVFHQTLTPSNVGTLTNIFRLRPGVIRGLHPTHSIAAIGASASELVSVDECDDTPCSAISPYGKLREWGGKVMIIGVGLECCTFFHGCEQWAGMPWAVTEATVPMYCVSADGTIIAKNMHHHFVNTWDQYPRLEPHLLQIDALKIGKIGDCDLRLLDCAVAAEWLIKQLHKDPAIILPDVLPEGFKA